MKKISLILVVLFLSHCAHKPPPMPSTSVEGPPTPTHPKPTSTNLRAGLVIGGAGVASFATVGILKRFAQEGVVLDFILATGWPAIFAVGSGYLKSVHDLEWFAMRLKPSDLFSNGFFDFSKDFSNHSNLASVLRESFGSKSLSQTSVPVLLSASPVGKPGVDVFSGGDWEGSLLKSISVPGTYRPYPTESSTAWVSSTRGVDVQEALRRTPVVIAVDMYDDYIRYLTSQPVQNSAGLFRTLYLNGLQKSVEIQMAEAPLRARISLGVAPNELGKRRDAVQAGYKEGGRLVSDLKRHLGQ